MKILGRDWSKRGLKRKKMSLPALKLIENLSEIANSQLANKISIMITLMKDNKLTAVLWELHQLGGTGLHEGRLGYRYGFALQCAVLPLGDDPMLEIQLINFS